MPQGHGGLLASRFLSKVIAGAGGLRQRSTGALGGFLEPLPALECLSYAAGGVVEGLPQCTIVRQHPTLGRLLEEIGRWPAEHLPTASPLAQPNVPVEDTDTVEVPTHGESVMRTVVQEVAAVETEQAPSPRRRRPVNSIAMVGRPLLPLGLLLASRRPRRQQRELATLRMHVHAIAVEQAAEVSLHQAQSLHLSLTQELLQARRECAQAVAKAERARLAVERGSKELAALRVAHQEAGQACRRRAEVDVAPSPPPGLSWPPVDKDIRIAPPPGLLAPEAASPSGNDVLTAAFCQASNNELANALPPGLDSDAPRMPNAWAAMLCNAELLSVPPPGLIADDSFPAGPQATTCDANFGRRSTPGLVPDRLSTTWSARTRDADLLSAPPPGLLQNDELACVWSDGNAELISFPPP
eukprot:NODE_6877_length_1629_cov_13.732357.p1 GENE.NODE_6877_length_1629_cov_13.732357~~NODE_6877_length_1629_cov_13.732357.p1  ORF type:complete len:413 (+),score=67.89 NODE_6877_length_1629_cov_13.732357:77-1315(+)